MIQILVEYPLLLLFIVAALGYFLGSIKLKGNSLGVAAILFTGLAFGAVDSRLQIPEIILQLGLSVYVYSIGLSSGPAFFNSYRKNGVRDFLFILGMLLFSGVIAVGLWHLFGFSAATITGIYSGSTTNTAALAGIIDYINLNFPAEEASRLSQEVVVGYSFSYPMGVMGGIIAIIFMEWILKIDYQKEKQKLKKEYSLEDQLTSKTIEVTNPEIFGIPLRDLFKKYDWNVRFGRIYQDGTIRLSSWDITLSKGDLIIAVGNEEELKNVTSVLGKIGQVRTSLNQGEFDARRIFVSNPKVAGRTIASLNLDEKYNAIITRIRRGDIDILATGETVLELGDRVRFIARRKDLTELSALFGDSYYASSRVNLFSFGLGIGLGLILGSINLPLGAEINFKLGYAGGPLIVGLILGALRRTGPIVWSLPYSANITLQQIGLILLLTTIGVRSGHAFVESLSASGLWIFIASAIISLLTAFSILFIGFKLIKKPFSLLLGIVSNQPAILDFATDKTKSRIPEIGFSMMFPIALISKIVIAQVLFLLLN